MGLLRNVPLVDQSVGSFSCEICFETYGAGGEDHRMSSGFCGHFFGRACWAAYVSESIGKDGVGCLSLKCPHPRHGAAAGEDLVLSVLATKGNGDADKYSRYLLRSYVEDSNGKRKWCPAPGCNCAVDFIGGYGTCDVSCLCSYRFCSNYNEEGLSPVNCDIVAKWMMLKNKDELENIECIDNIDWITDNTHRVQSASEISKKTEDVTKFREHAFGRRLADLKIQVAGFIKIAWCSYLAASSYMVYKQSCLK